MENEIEKIMDAVHKATAPEKMSVQEAITFTDQLVSDLRMYMDALEQDLEK